LSDIKDGDGQQVFEELQEIYGRRWKEFPQITACRGGKYTGNLKLLSTV
jgi:hypothetical protein